MVIQNQSKLVKGSAMPTDPHHTPTILQLSSQPQKTQKPRKPKKKDTQVVVPGSKKPWGILLLKLDDADNEMFDVNALNGEYVFVAGQNENVVKEVVDAAKVSTAATTVTLTTEEIALAQALEALKTSKPKVKEIVFQEPGKSTTTTTISSQQSQDKGEFDEEARLAKEKAEKEKESNIALIETWDDIDANIDVGHQLAERLQAKEQEDLSVEEKDTLFQQLLKKRRKHFAAKRVEDKRNKPPTQAQQRKIMCTYLKNMEGYK
ncbi:hypothetical protein Tco_1537341 [Tanacetum coccineum]